MNKARMIALGAATAVAVAAFMTVGLRGDLGFALELRAWRLAAIVQVGVAVALSTVAFQTITANRILTPSIMGMDAFFVLVQMLLVFTLGGIGYAALDDTWKFAAETLLMAALAGLLFLPVLRQRTELIVLLLTGVVLGVLFRSATALLARLIDPNDYAVVQGMSYADFNTINESLVAPGLALTAATAVLFWRWRHVLDVVALGRETAVGLGVAWRAVAGALLFIVGGLVAVSTALVGPVTFLGLLVVVLAERVAGTSRHGPLFVAACLMAVLLLAGGQTVLTHALGNAVTLGVLIEFAGGIGFLTLLFLRRQA